MKEKKVFKKIVVMTHPNGYSLNIEGEEFMYFNELDLLLGFLSRVGTGNTNDMEKSDLLNALFNSMLGQKYTQDVDKLKMTVNRLEARYADVTAKLQRELEKVKEANERHEKLTKRTEELTKLVDEMQQGYQKAYKPYDEYNKRISKLESQTTKMESHFNTATTEATTLLKSIQAMYENLDKLVNKISSRGDMMIGRMVKQVEKNVANMAEKKPDDEGGDGATFQDEKPIRDAAGTADEKPEPQGTVAGEVPVVSETDGATSDAKPKRKGGRPKKADGDKSAKKPRTKKADADKKAKPKAETPRQKRDKAILEKMMKDNPNIK